MLSHSQAAVFKGAVVLALLHAFDDAIVHRGAGVDLSQHALGLLLCVAIGAASIAAFAKLRVGARSLLALGLGSAATANGVAHAMNVEAHGPSSGDFTGLVALAAGLTLVGLAAWMPWRHRGEGAATRGRRIGARVTGSLATVALLLFGAVPVGLGIAEIHKGRSPIPAAPDHSYAEVAFDATDGARIAGWYKPSANGAAVIVLHGGGGDRTGTLAHAEMLARHGYGVLLYDARGRGESEGVANSYGWGWEKDAAGALDFVRAQPDVQDGRVGGLGLSSGADTMIDLAAHRRDLRAVVADGAAMRTHADVMDANGLGIDTAGVMPLFAAIGVLTGTQAPEPLRDLVARIERPLLLVSAGVEEDFNLGFMEVAGENAELWNRPDGHHTATLRERPEEYERRVVGFLDRSLLAER